MEIYLLYDFNLLLSKMEEIWLFTLCYILFSICFVFPPSEFISVGLTVESLFSFWLKIEAECFIYYHVKRIAATWLTHSCIPLGYVLGIFYFVWGKPSWEGSKLLYLVLIIALGIPAYAARVVYKWYQHNWKNHPITINLKNFTSGSTDINVIVRDIDNEYKSVDKIIIKCNALTKVVVTDNWIIKISPYMLNIAHQSDTSLVVQSCDSHLYIPDRPEGSEYLNIDVKSSRPNVDSFQIRINTADFKDLQEKMIRPISIMENVDFHGTLTDCFVKVFKKLIKQNPTVASPDNLDVCIGCLLATPNVKLLTSCGDTTGPNKCSMCYCKPLWCDDCMGKWFASRQDQDKPDNWLSSKATCPMCRSTFCLLDVCLLEPSTKNENVQS